MIIKPAKSVRGHLSLPGDKSISHRAALLAGIATGRSRITNYSTSADCASTLSCLSGLGIRFERNESELVIEGAGNKGLRAPDRALDCGNSGTTMRLLAGILAGQNFTATLTGDASLRARPMQRIIEPLEMMGAKVESVEGRAPLHVTGGRELQAIDYELLVASAQVKSCVLLAGLNANGKTTVIENEATRDHTERMLQLFGATIETGDAQREPAGARFASVIGPAQLRACDISIPGDISSAAYFLAAATMLPTSSLEISNVGVNPTRTAFLEVLAALNFIEVVGEHDQNGEPVGTIHAQAVTDLHLPEELSPLQLDGTEIPILIDEIPLLAVLGSQIRGGIEIRNAKELRVKESDRITATVDGLRAMGAEVEEFDDGMRVSGPVKLRGATIDSRGDHRIAMSFAVGALVAASETEIKDAECVAVSFPEFFDLLDSVVER